MNIAVILNKGIQEGGSFQYSLSMMALLRRHKDAKYNFIFFTTVKKNVRFLKQHGIEAFHFSWTNLDEFFSQIHRRRLVNDVFRKLKIGIDGKFDRLMSRHAIDLVYFVSPSTLALATARFNFIFTLWDLCFRDYVEFPEAYSYGEFERREELYGTCLRKAVKVIADSSWIREMVIKRYGVDASRIILLPSLPAKAMDISEEEYKKHYVDIKDKYRIDGDYIFYPAQFWPHKNHVFILEGLKILKEKHSLRINAVFSGSNKGNLDFVLKKAKDLGISDQVYYIGFAQDEELPYLYRQAMALVMPTYFGPTNTPPLEAFKAGCPVLYPDLPGSIEQVGGAVLPLDLNDPESLARGLEKVIKNDPELKILIANGKKKLDSLEKEDRWEKLKDVFDDYAIKLKCWK